MSSDILPKFQGRGAVMLDFVKSAEAEGKHFFCIRIPEDLNPLDRGDRYEVLLQEALSAAELGEVTGGGSQLGKGNTIEYCGIDVVVDDRKRGLELIRQTMQRLGAWTKTVMEEYLPLYREYLLVG